MTHIACFQADGFFIMHFKEGEGLRWKADGGEKYIYMRYHHGLGQMSL
jgi:hypothetical protein